MCTYEITDEFEAELRCTHSALGICNVCEEPRCLWHTWRMKCGALVCKTQKDCKRSHCKLCDQCWNEPCNHCSAAHNGGRFCRPGEGSCCYTCKLSGGKTHGDKCNRDWEKCITANQYSEHCSASSDGPTQKMLRRKS